MAETRIAARVHDADLLAGIKAAAATYRARLIHWTDALSRETGLPLDIAKASAQRGTRLRTPIDATLIAAQQTVLDTFGKAGEVKAKRPLAQAFVPLA